MRVIFSEGRGQTRLIIYCEHLVSIRLLEGQEVKCALLAAILAVLYCGAVIVSELADDYGQVPAAQVVLCVQDVPKSKLT